nr:MAG TPA: hypothetical protein [Caudoviricetes sp.]
MKAYAPEKKTPALHSNHIDLVKVNSPTCGNPMEGRLLILTGFLNLCICTLGNSQFPCRLDLRHAEVTPPRFHRGISSNHHFHNIMRNPGGHCLRRIQCKQTFIFIPRQDGGNRHPVCPYNLNIFNSHFLLRF